jgi:hypothetical protein
MLFEIQNITARKTCHQQLLDCIRAIRQQDSSRHSRMDALHKFALNVNYGFGQNKSDFGLHDRQCLPIGKVPLHLKKQTYQRNIFKYHLTGTSASFLE